MPENQIAKSAIYLLQNERQINVERLTEKCPQPFTY